jgi:hypothetical protein
MLGDCVKRTRGAAAPATLTSPSICAHGTDRSFTADDSLIFTTRCRRTQWLSTSVQSSTTPSGATHWRQRQEEAGERYLGIKKAQAKGLQVGAFDHALCAGSRSIVHAAIVASGCRIKHMTQHATEYIMIPPKQMIGNE